MAVALLSGCGETDAWEGFVYPNEHNLGMHIQTGIYPSLDVCRASVLDTIRSSGYRKADYECGLNCRRDEGLWICEKTSR